MSKLLEIALGLVTGIGGFLEAGSIATSVQAAAKFGFQLVWAIALGTICIAFLVEMAGRLGGRGRAWVERREDLSRIRLLVLTVALVPLVGCTSPDQKMEDAARTVHSWEATVRQTITAFDRQAVPRLYARQVLQAAVETKEQHARQPEWNALPAEVRGGLADAIDQLAASLGESSGEHSRE